MIPALLHTPLPTFIIPHVLLTTPTNPITPSCTPRADASNPLGEGGGKEFKGSTQFIWGVVVRREG